MSGVDHVDHFHLGGDFLCPPVFGRRGSSSSSLCSPLSLFLAFILPACLNTAVSIGVVGWLVRGAMNLARALQYAVQTGRSLIISFERLLPLTGLGSAESSIDCRVFSAVAVVASLMSLTPWLAVSIAAVRSAGMWRGAAASQPTVLARAKAGH